MLRPEDRETSENIEPASETIDTTNSGETGREGDKLSSQGLNPTPLR
jgi:hypothetical protein